MMTWQIGFLEFLVVEAGVFPGFGVGEAIGGDEWRRRGMATFQSATTWKARAGHVDKAMALLAQMEAIGLRPNSVSYSYLIDALGSIGRTLEADVLFQEMIFLGFRPRIKLYNVLLRGFLKKGLLGLAVGRHFS
ncbi:hypothetical protein ACLB2K_054810 [Fragaria x ananassa]